MLMMARGTRKGGVFVAESSRPQRDLTAPKNALARRGRALAFRAKVEEDEDEGPAEQLRTACFHAFEFTDDLSGKMLRRGSAATNRTMPSGKGGGPHGTLGFC